MFNWCRDLCRPKKDKDRKKLDKKDKHGSGEKGGKDGEGKNKHKMKNVYHYQIIGAGKKNVDQDSMMMLEIAEENTIVRFFGIFDGHGDFGKEAAVFANAEFDAFLRANVKKILKFRDLKDYKEKIKKMFKQLYIDTQKKYEKNVRNTYTILNNNTLEKDVLPEWNYWSVYPSDRPGVVYHECWRLSRNYV